MILGDSRRTLRRALAAAALAAAGAGVATAQSVWYVDKNGTPPGSGTASDPYTSIRYAHDQPTTLPDDVLVVAPGIYAEGVLQIDKRLWIRSSHGPEVTHIRGNTVHLNAWTWSDMRPILEGFTVSGVLGGNLVESNDAVLRRCILSGSPNTTGVFAWHTARIEESTIVGNAYAVSGHGFGYFIDMRNSVVWLNGSSDDGNILEGNIVHCAGTPPFSYKGDNGPHVLGDPMLLDIANGDFHLADGSPCIDAGSPAQPVDPDGSQIDIGALTY